MPFIKYSTTFFELAKELKSFDFILNYKCINVINGFMTHIVSHVRHWGVGKTQFPRIANQFINVKAIFRYPIFMLMRGNKNDLRPT